MYRPLAVCNGPTENVEFLPVNRAEIRKVSALKLEYIDANRQLIPVPLAELVKLATSSIKPLHDNPPRFIFHAAFTEQAENALRQYVPKKPMASLYGEKLIHNPMEIIKAVKQFLDLEISPGKVESIISSDSRHDDAKSKGERFSLQKRKERYQRL